MTRLLFLLVAVLLSLGSAFQFNSRLNSARRSVGKTVTRSKTDLRMLDDVGIDQNVLYGGMLFATLVPSILFVQFVGKAADTSRGTLSEDAEKRFKKKLMQTTPNLSLPSSEEDELKRMIAKAYQQDKDVDVAVLEKKLRERATWRKEMMAQRASQAQAALEDEDGW